MLDKASIDIALSGILFCLFRYLPQGRLWCWSNDHLDLERVQSQLSKVNEGEKTYQRY